MLCDECVRFFNSPWRKKFSKKEYFSENNLYEPEILKRSSCEFCTFLAACSTKSVTLSMRDEFLSSAKQYKIYLFGRPDILEHNLRILNLDDKKKGATVDLKLSRMS
ncbi:hypothetical protein B0O99DRAFT_679207, partial [Bisporella sp. PMI_857]